MLGSQKVQEFACRIHQFDWSLGTVAKHCSPKPTTLNSFISAGKGGVKSGGKKVKKSSYRVIKDGMRAGFRV